LVTHRSLVSLGESDPRIWVRLVSRQRPRRFAIDAKQGLGVLKVRDFVIVRVDVPQEARLLREVRDGLLMRQHAEVGKD
jgi:hypothetical protein